MNFRKTCRRLFYNLSFNLGLFSCLSFHQVNSPLGINFLSNCALDFFNDVQFELRKFYKNLFAQASSRWCWDNYWNDVWNIYLLFSCILVSNNDFFFYEWGSNLDFWCGNFLNLKEFNLSWLYCWCPCRVISSVNFIKYGSCLVTFLSWLNVSNWFNNLDLFYDRLFYNNS